ncbi:protein-disulfide reductase DsbD [Legionella massiliensis]|nr:protein-disulfide reductase DsbD [Legionella massiliensis]
MKKWLLVAVFWSLAFLTNATPLPASEVFQIEAKLFDPNTLIINWQIKPGYFLYSDRIKLDETPNSNVHVGTIRFPETMQKVDKQGRVYTIYRDKLSVPVAILGEQPGESLIEVHYQGCADDGFCYPPETRQIKLTIDNNLALTDVSLEGESLSTSLAEPPQPPQDETEAVFINHHWAFVILSFWFFGLLLAFTPCILPMIPVLSGIIVGHGHEISTRKAFFLSLSYVLSMSFTYAVVGAVVATLGSNLQVLMQTPWAISLFSLIFVILALSMFGYYDLRLPVSWQAKLANLSRGQSSGHYIGAAIMGALSTLILSPCVTPPLMGALGYIAHSGNMALGSSALFFLGLGMGTPLLLIGASAGKWLPKAGKWMNAVKTFFGVLLLAVALYLMGRILPSLLVMGLWAALMIFSGIYCGALALSKTNLEKFGQGLGIMLLLYGILVLVGASMGNTNPLQPLVRVEASAAIKSSDTKTVNTINELQKALKNAKGKPVMLDFYADWCSSCQVMEATLFKDPRVESVLKDFVVLKVDITANKEQQKALLSQFNVVAPPTFVFLNKQGKEQTNLRLVGETPTNKFLKQLDLALGD